MVRIERIKLVVYCRHMATKVWINISSDAGSLPDGTKPSPRTMLTNHQWSHEIITWRLFHKRFLTRQPAIDDISFTMASDAEHWCFPWCAPEQTVEQANKMSVFETPWRSLWRHCYVLWRSCQVNVKTLCFMWDYACFIKLFSIVSVLQLIHYHALILI